MTERIVCECFGSGKQMCRPCFMVWYDSGITNAEHLFAEVSLRKERGAFPFGTAPIAAAELNEIAARFSVQP